MWIKIIKGMYGHRENGRIVEKNEKSGPFEAADAEAARLIRAGVAVDASPEAGLDEVPGKVQDDGQGQQDAAQAGDGQEVGTYTRGQLEQMKLNELQEIAGQMGLAKDGTKKELVNGILIAAEEMMEGDIPELTAAELE